MKFLTFGEIMLRLKAPGMERLLTNHTLEATFGGGEANVAVSLANYGMDVGFLTVLPDNPITDACVRELRGFGVDTSRIVTGDGRFGVYYVEGGANQLPSRVVYDRAWSAIAMAKPGDIDWDKAFEGVEWFHITGITPAISESARALSLESVQEAKKRGITVSCDLNYRKNLWKYARIRTTTGFAGGCVLLFFQSGVFCLCLAVQAAVCACRRVGQREYLRKLLFHGGYAARVFAVDDIFDPRRELELALFHLLAVLDEVHRNARVNIADHVPVQIQNAVNFDDVLAAKLIADNIFEQRHRAIELVKIQYLI